MKRFAFFGMLMLIVVNLTSAQQAWTLNRERGSKITEPTVKTFWNGAEGIFKIESPESGWEYDGPMNLPIVTVDRRTIGTGKPGPATKKLQHAFRQLTKTEGIRY